MCKYATKALCLVFTNFIRQLHSYSVFWCSFALMWTKTGKGIAYFQQRNRRRNITMIRKENANPVSNKFGSLFTDSSDSLGQGCDTCNIFAVTSVFSHERLTDQIFPLPIKNFDSFRLYISLTLFLSHHFECSPLHFHWRPFYHGLSDHPNNHLPFSRSLFISTSQDVACHPPTNS